MTCIVGIAEAGKVWIGGDSAGVGHKWDLIPHAGGKIFRNGPFLMGFTTSFRMGQLLAFKLRPPAREPATDVMGYMVTAFVDEVRRCLKVGGYATKDKDAESAGFFLVGYAGRLFQIQSGYEVIESLNAYDAVGCGDQLALGVLHATAGLEPRERIAKALAAAEALSAGVRSPFYIKTLEASP